MNRKREEMEENDEPSSPAWMTTFSDLMTLLLTFFVLLLSFSDIDNKKFINAINSLKGALGIMKQFPSPRAELGYDFSDEVISRRQSIYDNVTELQRKAKELGLEEDVNIQVAETGLLIQMGDRILFDLGKADIKEEAFPILDVVGKTIHGKAGEVLVSGHTDNIPIHTPEFPSNWELSSARAISVVRYLINNTNVEPEILGATAFSKFKPLVPNDNAENRKRNRRVEFLVTWK